MADGGENCTLFIGNLPFQLKEHELRELVESHGFDVSKCQLITHRDSGESRGFGYVEFESGAMAQKAKDKLHGEDVNGRELKIDMATSRGGGGGRGGYGTPRGGGGRGRGGRDFSSGGRGTPHTPSNRLYIKLSSETQRETLKSIFTNATDVFLPKDRDTGEQRGFGFISFDDISTAEKALKEHSNIEVDGVEIYLRFATEKGAGGGGGGYGGR